MLVAAKDYLRVTWADDDDLLNELIARGKKKLEELAGAAPDFEGEGLARSLLFDYVRYAYNNASEYFEENFSQEIMRLQIVTGVSLLPEDDADEV